MIKNVGGVDMEEESLKKKLDIDERKSSNIKYRQSANSLFNFMPKIEYLHKKLLDKRIVPRYVSENVRYLKVPKFFTFEVPMICFCDINLHKISLHAKGDGNFNGYGCFAIAFSKEFCLKKSVQPVHYVNEDSEFFNSFSNTLNVAMDCTEYDDIKFECLSDHLVKEVMFMKPLTGTQNEKLKNFHDEQEWRFVPDLSKSDMQLFLTNDKILDKYNKAIEKLADKKDDQGKTDKYNICFKFEYSDIKYLIIDREENRSSFIDWIMRLKDKVSGCTEKDCMDLISKIRVLETIEEDA